ncbi:carboxymuconolactone decarboxylase family protein [Streptomyces sp. 3214.6]|uniref:carboxymuconolactone decarboxylase family protein n=1 Tax=Streptomyces sp. 3214.6 TaxID=1882757 RepID=UPI00090B471D|nr:carboxymuconolactone decarboxylase family protein [Streptomyces sp. 3214.6]SHH31038.1 Alkylhydroperoxidase family enzyme, contains CxxC motif [Streptomyces sp. 3214.6]
MSEQASPPRIELLPVAEWDPEVREVWAADTTKKQANGLPPQLKDIPDTLNLTRIFAHHPSLAVAFYPLSRMVNEGRLPHRDRELVTLRTALRSRSGYEWSHHYEMAQTVGVTEAEVLRTAEDPAGADWSPHEVALLTAVDEICDDSAISDATWRRLRRTYDEAQVLELLALAGTYRLLASVLNTSRAPLEDWRPERPLPAVSVPADRSVTP